MMLSTYLFRVSRLLAASTLCCLTFSHSTNAAEDDWLYFPMYDGDNSHAVHFKALEFRSDGLLSSRSRYPAAPDPNLWTAEQIEQSWHVYSQYLIDCETGFQAETQDGLLNQDDKVIASLPVSHDKVVERLVRDLSQQDLTWPNNSEIFLACAGAASKDAIKERRAKRGAPAVISYQSTIQILKNESNSLFELSKATYDISMFQTSGKLVEPVKADAISKELRSQYLAWKRAYNPAYTPPDYDVSEAAKDSLTKLLERESGYKNRVRLFAEGFVEYESNWENAAYMSEEDLPEKIQGISAIRSTVHRIDCVTQLTVPMGYLWRDEDNKILDETTLSDDQILTTLMDYRDVEVGAYRSDVLAVCKQITAGANGEANEQSQVNEAEETGDESLAYGITRSELAKQKTVADMLLLVRSAKRKATQH